MNCRILLILLLLFSLAGCNEDKYEELIKPEVPMDVVEDNESSEKDVDDTIDENVDENDNDNVGQNLLENGGLEKWLMVTSYTIPNSWQCYNNANVQRNFTIVYEGRASAKMQSRKKGSTASVGQKVMVTPNHKIRIRFHYYIEEWKDKGARTYCYFRTGSAENTTISADVLKAFYDKNTYYIIRGGGYGLTYLPHELNKWLTFDDTIEVPPTANYFVFGVNSYYGTTIYIDDCWVIDTSL